MSSEQDEQNGSGSGGPSKGGSPKGGRPPKPERKRRTETYGLRLSPEEMEELEAKAKTAGLERSEFIRRRVFGKPISTEVEKETTRELNRIGVNLNQLAYRANKGEMPDVAAEAKAAIEEVRALIGEIGQMQSE